MSLSALHRAVDRAAMWLEDRVPRMPSPYRKGPAGPLACFGELPPLPPPPGGAGGWSAPGLPGDPAAGRLASPDDRMRLHCYPARGARRGTAVLVPPWKLPRLDVLRGWVGLVAGAGLDAWVLVPPHHLERARPGARSGEGFISPDLGRLRISLERTVVEIRVAAALARRTGPVGVLGLSLGALAAALAATAPEPLDFAALVAPPADLGWVLGRTPIGRRYAEMARRGGAPLPPAEVLRGELAPFDPSGRRPTARRVLVAAGREDLIAGRDGPEALARAWGLAPRLYPRGHLTLLLACRALRRDVAAFLRATTSSPPTPAARPAPA